MSLQSHQVAALLDGTTTLAALAGLTQRQAHAIAQTGVELADAGCLDSAASVFEGLAAINPRDDAVQIALGITYLKLERPADAEAVFDRVLARAPANAVALTHRGELRLRRGQRAPALLDLRNAVAADPNGKSPAGARARNLLRALSSAGQR